jgi:hypothetical protein
LTPINNEDPMFFVNWPFAAFSNWLKSRIELKMAFEDKTLLKNNVNIQLRKSLTDTNFLVLKKELNRYGLDLVEGYKNLDVLVIKEL